MSWNYRIVCTIYKGKRKFYDVREVYYTGKKPGAMTVDEISPCGSTMEEFGRSKKCIFRIWKSRYCTTTTKKIVLLKNRTG